MGPLLTYEIFLLADKWKRNGILLQWPTINITMIPKWFPVTTFKNYVIKSHWKQHNQQLTRKFVYSQYRAVNKLYSWEKLPMADPFLVIAFQKTIWFPPLVVFLPVWFDFTNIISKNTTWCLENNCIHLWSSLWALMWLHSHVDNGFYLIHAP